jgi:hypothetical protein
LYVNNAIQINENYDSSDGVLEKISIQDIKGLYILDRPKNDFKKKELES